MKADPVVQEKWQTLVKTFLQSKKSYPSFSKEHNIQAYQLQYWVQKFKPKKEELIPFTQVEIKRERTSQTMKVWIRSVAIEIPIEIDEASLRRLIKVVDSLV